MRYFQVILILLMSGCSMNMAGSKITYAISIANVHRTFKDSNAKLGFTSFSDSLIDINFSFSSYEAIYFNITNKTDEPIKLIWDEVTFHFDQIYGGCIHNGIPYINRNDIQAPSILLPNIKVSEQALPKIQVTYSTTWIVTPYLLEYAFTERLQKEALSLKDKYITLYMPFIIGEKKHSYTFKFQIDNVLLPAVLNSSSID